MDAQKQNLSTPLCLASDSGCLEIVELLLGRGANVHVRNDEGLTVSQAASRRGEREIVRLLSARSMVYIEI
jgi:ankyrin repeat protein